jgi:hypothetical protein
MPSSKKELAYVALAGSALVAILLFPFLFMDRLFVDSDATLYYYPVFDFFHNALVSGQSILWNPNIFSGFPTYLSQSAGFFDPLNLLLFRFLETFNAYHLRLFIDLVLVIIFSYYAGRRFGLSGLLSFAIGPAYISAFNWRYLSNLVIANSMFVLPLLIWLAFKIFDGERVVWRYVVLAAVGVGVGFLSGYAQMVVYACTLFAMLLLWLTLSGSQFTYARLGRVLGILLAIAALGFVLGSPQIIPSVSFSSLTVREGGLDYSQTLAKVVEPGDTALFLFPDYLYFPYLSSGRKPLYVGPILFILALTYVLAIMWRWKREGWQALGSAEKISLAVFFIALFAFVASIKWSPIFYLLHKLPVFGYFRFPYRWMYLGVWFVALLGALGLDYFTKAVERNATRIFTVIAGALSVLMAFILSLNVLGSAVWTKLGDILHVLFGQFLYGRLGLVKDVSHYREAIEKGTEAWRESADLSSVSFALPFVILCFASIILGLYFSGRMPARRFKNLAISLSLATALAVFLAQWPSSLPQSVTTSYEWIYEHIPKEDRQLYRVFPFELSYGFGRLVPPKYYLSRDEVLALNELEFATGWPNMNIYSGIMSVDGYDPFLDNQLLKVLSDSGSTHGGEEATKKLSSEVKASMLLSHLGQIGEMSGGYVLSGLRLDHPALVLLETKFVSRYQVPVYLYKNNLARPRFELVGDKTAPLEIREIKNGSLKFRVESSAPSTLIIRERFLPGWRAAIDDEVVAIETAKDLYFSVKIPPGSFNLDFVYKAKGPLPVDF